MTLPTPPELGPWQDEQGKVYYGIPPLGPNELGPRQIAVIVDGVVLEVQGTTNELAEILLKQPTFVEVTDRNPIVWPGYSYDGEEFHA